MSRTLSGWSDASAREPRRAWKKSIRRSSVTSESRCETINGSDGSCARFERRTGSASGGRRAGISVRPYRAGTVRRSGSLPSRPRRDQRRRPIHPAGDGNSQGSEMSGMAYEVCLGRTSSGELTGGFLKGPLNPAKRAHSGYDPVIPDGPLPRPSAPLPRSGSSADSKSGVHPRSRQARYRCGK